MTIPREPEPQRPAEPRPRPQPTEPAQGCPTCGALVADPARHASWHGELERRLMGLPRHPEPERPWPPDIPPRRPLPDIEA